MSYQIDYAYTCHIGNVRANNEDNFWCCGATLPAENQGIEGVHTGSVHNTRLPVLSVFDGMGGESCGEIAAFLAAEEFGRYYSMNKKGLKKNPGQFLADACFSMNEGICIYGAENRVRCMGTTMAMAAFTPKSVYICNLGDSRIYQSYQGQFRQISTDHVVKANMFGKAPLTQYLGIPNDEIALDPDVTELDYICGSRYLLCSDGMTDMLSDGEIADILTREISVSETVEVLLDRTLKKGGKDNVTIVLCEVSDREEKNPLKMLLKRHRKVNFEGDVS